MPMIGCEKLNKDDFKSVDKSQGGLLSLWNWLIKKDKCCGPKKQNADKKTIINEIIQRLSAEELQELKACGVDIDIQKLQTLSNKKIHPHRNQSPKDKLNLKENGIPNESVMSSPLNKRKSVNKKLDTNLVVTASFISVHSKHSKDNGINSISQHVFDMKSHKCVVNNFSYKLGKKSNTKLKSNVGLPHRSILMESVPPKILQSNTHLKEVPTSPICHKLRKARRLSKSGHIRQDSPNNQPDKTEETKIISPELTKTKSVEKQLCNTDELKIKSALSKQNALKISPARHNLNNINNLPLHNETKKYISCKIYSTNKNFSRSLKKVHRKMAKKKSKFVLSSASEPFSTTGDLKNKGYPFDNFKDSLNNFSLDFSASISIEPILNTGKTKYFETFSNILTPIKSNINKNSFGDHNNASFNIEINGVTFKSKVPKNHSELLITNQRQNTTTQVVQKPQNTNFNSKLHNGSVASDHGMNIADFNTKNVNMIQSNACITKRCSTGIFVGQGLLKPNIISSKPDFQINTKTSLKSLSLQLKKENEDQIMLTGERSNVQENEHYSNECVSNDKLLKSERSCDIIDNVLCESVFSNEQGRLDNQNNNANKGKKQSNIGRLDNQNNNANKELTMPSPEETKEPQIKVTILIEDNLKNLVDLKSNVAINKKECTDIEDFCNAHKRSLHTAEDNLNGSTVNKKEHFIICDSFSPLQKVNNKSTVENRLKLKNLRINNEIENNDMNLRTVKSNIILSTPKPRNIIEDNSLQFGNDGRYLYKKEREWFDQLCCNKQSLNDFNGSFSKTNTSKKHVGFQYDNNKIKKESSFIKIKENLDIDFNTAETELKVDNNLTNNSHFNNKSENNANKTLEDTSLNPLSELTNSEIKTIDLIKAQQDCFDDKLEEKQFFRIIGKKYDENISDDKLITTDQRKRSCRYSLTLSQEPQLEESEDGMSSKDIIYNDHQSVKGDNIEIKSMDYTNCYNVNETVTCEKDIVFPIQTWLDKNDSRSDEPFKSPLNPLRDEPFKSSSVLVQTDWSLIGKNVRCINDVPMQTVSCQTDSIIFDKETTDNSDSCLKNNHSKLVSCDLTIESEERENTPSENQVHFGIMAEQQNGMLYTNNIKTLQTKHQCTARCFYSVSQENSLASESQSSESKISTMRKDNNFTSKTEGSVNTTSDHITNIKEENRLNDNRQSGKFCKETMKKEKSESKKINSNKSKDCRTLPILFSVDSLSERRNNNNKTVQDKLDLNIPESLSNEPKTKPESQQENAYTLSDIDEIEQDLSLHKVNTVSSCCVDCKLDGYLDFDED